MSKILNLSDEIALIDSPDFELGKYIYLGQVRTEDGATAVRALVRSPGDGLMLIGS